MKLVAARDDQLEVQMVTKATMKKTMMMDETMEMGTMTMIPLRGGVVATITRAEETMEVGMAVVATMTVARETAPTTFKFRGVTMTAT